MSRPIWPFRVNCKHQEWYGDDVPFCECKLFRKPMKPRKTAPFGGYYMRGCWYSHCPRKKFFLSLFKRRKKT